MAEDCNDEEKSSAIISRTSRAARRRAEPTATEAMTFRHSGIDGCELEGPFADVGLPDRKGGSNFIALRMSPRSHPASRWRQKGGGGGTNTTKTSSTTCLRRQRVAKASVRFMPEELFT